MKSNNNYKVVSDLVKNSECIIVLAGAGMSVDSGINAYRGDDGFWNKELEINGLRINQLDLMSHQSFEENPDKSWSLIAYLLDLFEEKQPHLGYYALLSLLDKKDYFVYTSNIDKQFLKSGYDEKRIVECHGSIYKMQCTDILERENWNTPKLELDYSKFTLNQDYPKCPKCEQPCRPNLFLFGDFFWISKDYLEQEKKYNDWKKSIFESNKKVLVFEIGAGTTVNTLRKESERLSKLDIPIIRINTSEFQVSQPNEISISASALEAIENIRFEFLKT